MAKKKQVTPIITDEEMGNMEYVLYCRKSRDEDDKQVASIPRQISLCLKHAEEHGLAIKQKPKDFPFEDKEEIIKEDNCSDMTDRELYLATRNLYIIKEQHSAKTPRKRPKWTKLMRMVERGEIRGILSYSPDRQARNIMEGGEVINFVDEKILDLKYSNFHFDPNASGKMMLGIWFVFSKQYSDKLSEDVSNANERKFKKAETLGDKKHGYISDDNNKWKPDGDNWLLLKKAFRMHLEEGWGDRELANWLNMQGYRTTVKRTGEKKKISKSTLNRIWTDPFYYGTWIRGNQTIDLRQEDLEFKPMITYAEYQVLCELHHRQLESKKAKSGINKKDKYADIRTISNDFIKHKDRAGNVFNLTLNIPSFQRDFGSRLEAEPNLKLEDIIRPDQIRFTAQANKYKVEVKQSDIDSAVMKKLKQLKLSSSDYAAYLQYSVNQLEADLAEMEEDRRRLQLRINNLSSERNAYILRHTASLGTMDAEERDIYERKKKDYEEQITFVDGELLDLNSKEKNLIFTTDLVAKFFKNAVQYYKKATYVQKAKIIKILFSNVAVSKQKRLTLAVNPTSADLFVQDGRGAGTRTQDPLVPNQVL